MNVRLNGIINRYKMVELSGKHGSLITTYYFKLLRFLLQYAQLFNAAMLKGISYYNLLTYFRLFLQGYIVDEAL